LIEAQEAQEFDFNEVMSSFRLALVQVIGKVEEEE